MRLVVAEGEVRATVDLSVETREAVYGAAYLLTDRAHASLEPAGKGVLVTLRPKGPAKKADLQALSRAFEAELATQKVRWAIARQNAPIREFVVRQAIAGPESPPPGAPAAEELTAEQKAEIDRLIAEVEAELREQGPSKADPKGIAKTWEEKHGKS